MAKEQERELNDIENMLPLQSPRLASPAMSPLVSPYGSPGMSTYGSPNGTSMGINTQKFLMLFLVMPQPRKLTLDFAARVIHGREIDRLTDKQTGRQTDKRKTDYQTNRRVQKNRNTDAHARHAYKQGGQSYMTYMTDNQKERFKRKRDLESSDVDPDPDSFESVDLDPDPEV